MYYSKTHTRSHSRTHTQRYQTTHSPAHRHHSSGSSQRQAYSIRIAWPWVRSRPTSCRLTAFQRLLCGVFRNLINLSPSARRRSADQLLLYLGPRGEGRLAEREGVTTRLQLTLARAHEVWPDQVQLRWGSRALGLRLRLACLRLIQRGVRPSMEVGVGVGMRERVQPGVVEAFLCRGSLPVHTNTITRRMRGNSRRVNITDGLPGSSDLLNLFSCRRRRYFFSTFGLEKPQEGTVFLLSILSPTSFSDYSHTEGIFHFFHHYQLICCN